MNDLTASINSENYQGTVWFSPSTYGFYILPLDKDIVPDDAVEISEGVETFLRFVIIVGADHFEVTKHTAKVTYPEWLHDYVAQYNYPSEYSEPENA